MQADALASAVTDGMASFRMALAVHFRSNHYPPIPYDYIDVATEVIEHLDSGCPPEDVFKVPDVAMIPRCAQRRDGAWWCTAADLAEVLHLWAFIEDGVEGAFDDED